MVGRQKTNQNPPQSALAAGCNNRSAGLSTEQSPGSRAPGPFNNMDQPIQSPYIKKLPIPAQFNRRLFAMLRTADKR